MIKLCVVFLVIFPFLALAKDGSNCDHSKTEFHCVKYLKNYDGDTITFNIPNVHPLLGHKISVRVNGVDTAETKTKNPCEKAAGRTARKYVANLLKHAKRVDLLNVQRGKYFRILADVIIDGRNLKDLLLDQRLAYSYQGATKPKIDWCQFGRSPATSTTEP
ncbi:MAG: thermonuclease family protein [Bdellovibrionales bacterium]|nr:thermonuclease family protein [Bdellovibrionales bacterium]